MSDSAIPRHKTAIRRGDFSRPIKCALRDRLVDQSVTVFDYGCGRGEDVELLSAEGVTCDGWDPVFRPETQLGGKVIGAGLLGWGCGAGLASSSGRLSLCFPDEEASCAAARSGPACGPVPAHRPRRFRRSHAWTGRTGRCCRLFPSAECGPGGPLPC